ncbi:MAG: glycoside hydrolase [Pirellulales bacterium]|nr:glycoside hydrolase [Pirellulales bacterium]
MKKHNGIELSLNWVISGVCLLLPIAANDVAANEPRLASELSFAAHKNERPQHLRLLSGKLFRERDNHAETSADGGKSWQRGGQISPFKLSSKLDDVAIQLQSARNQGRIVVPYYLGMYGKHPDFDVNERGGYARWKGAVIRLETHTHHPEMSGSFVCYSDDEGNSWRCSVNDQGRGFMMGYFQDGLQGHVTCEEPVVVELKDGHLLCFMRSSCGRILQSTSEDGGEHWMKVRATSIAMSNSPCALRRLPETGDLVLLWNMVSAEEISNGYRRGRLAIAISKDDGLTWENVQTLGLSPGLQKSAWVKPPPLQPMIRGSSGRDNLMGNIPDGFMHYHYGRIYLSKKKVFIRYAASPPEGAGSVERWRVFPISQLYEPK